MYMSISTGADIGEDHALISAISWTKIAQGNAHPLGRAEVGTTASADLIFTLSAQEMRGGDVIASHVVEASAGPAFLRVDEVCFPVGAIAHRHTHAGSGYRHLVSGRLRIEAAGHAQDMEHGDSWFEPAQAPVRAVALQTTGVTRFVRCMVVPPEYEGKSTFILADAADADLPRLQLTHRHIDQAIYVEAG